MYMYTYISLYIYYIIYNIFECVYTYLKIFIIYPIIVWTFKKYYVCYDERIHTKCPIGKII